MTSNQQFLHHIQQEKLIAIIRGIPQQLMAPLFEALYEGGIRIVEVTMNSPDALQSIRAMNDQFGTKMMIGAGTVLDGAMAWAAVEAGSRFLLAPNLDEEMIRTAIQLGIPSIPGVLTPSEIMIAVRLGAPFVKLFPISSFGPKYIQEIRAPLDQINMIAVGGIHESNARAYLEAGAIGLGVGGSLIDKSFVAAGDFKAITEKAKRLVSAVQD
ncbi:hypothetical protein A8709_32575 [Paenibacillus pectinilyticus]|uniref:2-dehydro-3-deoxyphosphogluconate aldolase n=1 Tax=Paenibacillus pectinilyticus TaxID=512399 RepID=A0A1C0ZXI6_9BACL|nr:bifunctional 4-hydroxy-2-oxoglutarate aldolase/2-dehydro-3-deoxy-phosphogluconate aldolase [Paenibacillus pectinilyticus]OCT12787.1 hypothetical protein A8709_32575 [Paenibacillus pectinilyticus]